MIKYGLTAAFGGAALALSFGPAAAAPISELRVGVLAHNVQVTDPKNANKEDGPNVELGIAFKSPGFLNAVGAPRPYLAGSVNLAGDTSFIGGGLAWRLNFNKDWAFEPAFGVAWRSGPLNNPFPNNDPRAQSFARKNIINSSRDVFHSTLGITRRVGDKARLGLVYEHLSHGQILGEGRNQGIDQVGLRLSWALSEQ